MIKEIRIHKHKDHNFGHTLGRCAMYALRGCIAAVGTAIVCVAFVMVSPLALYDYLCPRGRKLRRERRTLGTDQRISMDS